MRLVALISMVKWCKEDRHSFERIQAEMRETERTPDARKLLMQVRPRAINPNPNPLTLTLTLTPLNDVALGHACGQGQS